MITEEQLKSAALELDEMLTEHSPEQEDMAYSPRFHRKMKRLLRRKNRSLLGNRFFHAAAVLLTVLLLGALVLGTGDDAAASFKGLYAEVHENSYYYVLNMHSDENPRCAYRVGWLPEGYTFTHGTDRYSHGYAFFHEADTKKSIMFMYSIERSLFGSRHEQVIHEEKYELRDTIINGRGADLFVITNKDGSISYKVIWMNEEHSVLFSVSGCRSEEEAVRLAESVEEYQLEE